MSDPVICLLSDSDEDLQGNATSENPSQDDAETDDDFPVVNFHYAVKTSSDPGKRKDFRENVTNPLKSTTNYTGSEASRSTGRGSKENDTGDDPEKNHSKQQSKKPARTRTIFKDDTEKSRSKERAAIEKRMRALEKKNRKNIQRGECMKFIQVSVDRELERYPFHSEILDAHKSYDVSCRLESLSIPNSITWTRTIENHYLNESNDICTRTENQVEKEVIVIWRSEEVVERIADHSFCCVVESIASLIPHKRLTLIVYGTEEYFERSKKSKKKASAKSNEANCPNVSSDLPKISRHDLEFNLAEIQLTLGCGSSLVETAQELGALVYRFTKAIAEIPLKQETRGNIVEKMDWYAMGDKKDTVKVDKNGIGLKRLWQQQLCQFNLASLETAEAICAVYPSPRELMRTYAACTPEEGEKLLKDIPIRRAAGPLSTVRKIGPELSKKIFVMFTSKNGEDILGNDRQS